MQHSGWTFFTNHGHVLLCLATHPELRMKDIATRVQITERAVQKIISDLAEAGYLVIERQGRRNQYRVLKDKPLRHPVESHKTVDDLIAMVHPDEK
jgi:DNA-binding MarR family transcriptional regulator